MKHRLPFIIRNLKRTGDEIVNNLWLKYELFIREQLVQNWFQRELDKELGVGDIVHKSNRSFVENTITNREDNSNCSTKVCSYTVHRNCTRVNHSRPLVLKEEPNIHHNLFPFSKNSNFLVLDRLNLGLGIQCDHNLCWK